MSAATATFLGSSHAAPGKWVAAFLEADAAEIRLRAERRLGLMIEPQKKTVGLNEGGRPKTGYIGGPGFEKPARSLDCERGKECGVAAGPCRGGKGREGSATQAG
jgi:hypothetical protein